MSLLFAGGGLLTWAEAELGLFNWVDRVEGADNRHGRGDIYVSAAAVQALLLGLAGAYRWRRITRLRLGGALLAGALLTALELRFGWLNWALRDSPNRGKAFPLPLLFIGLQALVALLPIYIATSGLPDDD